MVILAQRAGSHPTRDTQRGYDQRRAPAPLARAPRRRRARLAPSCARRTAGRGRKRWAAAVGQLRTLQAEYQTWRDQLPESLADSRTAELLAGVCDVDLDALDVELPRGFGRD